MKTAKELRMELNLISQRMFGMFSEIAKTDEHKKELELFIDEKERFHQVLSKLAGDGNQLPEPICESTIIRGVENDYVASVGQVILSRSGDRGLLILAFIDGEVLVLKEFSFQDEGQKLSSLKDLMN